MPINNATFAEGATPAFTGGTTKTLVTRGGDFSKNSLYVDEDSDSTTRRTVEITARESRSSAGAPGGFTQERVSIIGKYPKVLANLNRTVNSIKTEFAVDPETTVAERDAMRLQHCQMILGDDFDALFEKNNAN